MGSGVLAVSAKREMTIGDVASSGRGSSPVLTTLAADLGGSRLKVAVVRGRSVEHLAIVPVGEDATTTLLTSLQRLLDHVAADRIGLALPGIVRHGRVLSLPGKLSGVAGRAVADLVEQRFGMRCLVFNDAIAAGVGEARFGAGSQHNHVLVLTIGTGVGVCVLDRGRPIGSGPLAGGILGGFIPIAHSSALADSNGGRGTIEALCAASCIVNQAGHLYSDVAAVYAASAAAEGPALAALDRYRADLVCAIVALVHAHGVEIVVVTGGVITASGPILDGVEEAVNRRLFEGVNIEVRRGTLHSAAALLGINALLDDNEGMRS
jgi:glucokinase